MLVAVPGWDHSPPMPDWALGVQPFAWLSSTEWKLHKSIQNAQNIRTTLEKRWDFLFLDDKEALTPSQKTLALLWQQYILKYRWF